MNRIIVTLLLVVSTLGSSLSSEAASRSPVVTITLKPGQCVALHQGQKCYVDVELAWQASETGNYCLYAIEIESQGQANRLHCWQNTSAAEFDVEVGSAYNLTFYISLENDQQPLASTELKQAWVYQKSSRSRSSWRMF